MAWLRLSRHGREHIESASATQSADNPSLFRVSVPLCAFAISQAATLTLISPDLWLLFLLGQRQKFFVCDFAVLHVVDSHLRHLRSFLRRFLGHIHIELHYERISGYKRPAHFHAVNFHIFLPPLCLTSHLINAAHFRRHVFHRVRFYANALLCIEFVDCFHPFFFMTIIHQLCCDFFSSIHSFSLFLIENCSTDICVTFDGRLFLLRAMARRVEKRCGDASHSKSTSCEIRANRLVFCAPAYPPSFSRSLSQLSARNGTDYYKWLRPLCDGFGQRSIRRLVR